MTYLVCMLLLAVTLLFFLLLLSVFERGHWPSEKALTPSQALRELVQGRWISKN